jgi:hypothetical protein
VAHGMQITSLLRVWVWWWEIKSIVNGFSAFGLSLAVFLLLFVLSNVLPRCSGRNLSKLPYFATVAFLQHCVEFLAITIASRRLFYENSVAFVQERHLRLI